MTTTLLPHHLAPTPADAPHQPGDRVKIIHVSPAGPCLSEPTLVRECVQGPSGRWMVAVDAPTGLPERLADARPGLCTTMPEYVHPEAVWLFPHPETPAEATRRRSIIEGAPTP